MSGKKTPSIGMRPEGSRAVDDVLGILDHHQMNEVYEILANVIGMLNTQFEIQDEDARQMMGTPNAQPAVRIRLRLSMEAM